MQRIVGEGVCEFHIFDYGDFASKVPLQLKRAQYHKWGLTRQVESTTKAEGKNLPTGKKMYGLQDAIKLLGHENLEVIDIFVSRPLLGDS